jgi:hypothetical protein
MRWSVGAASRRERLASAVILSEAKDLHWPFRPR